MDGLFVGTVEVGSFVWRYPLRELTYPSLGKGTSSGYFRYQEGTSSILAIFKDPQKGLKTEILTISCLMLGKWL